MRLTVNLVYLVFGLAMVGIFTLLNVAPDLFSLVMNGHAPAPLVIGFAVLWFIGLCGLFGTVHNTPTSWRDVLIFVSVGGMVVVGHLLNTGGNAHPVHAMFQFFIGSAAQIPTGIIMVWDTVERMHMPPRHEEEWPSAPEGAIQEVTVHEVRTPIALLSRE